MEHETNEANLPTQLMAKPVLSWEEFWDSLLGLPKSTSELVARQDPTPKFFLIGRRRYIRTADAVEWLDQAASASPYFPRRNKRAAA
jgi:hypothetical protein